MNNDIQFQIECLSTELTSMIMEKYGWEDKIPNTWDDVIDLVADLQAESLQFYLPVNDSGATALNPIFVSLLYQMGGELYINDN